MATPTLAKYSLSEFAEDVRWGLTKDGQKEIHSKYLYDEVGSALFEVITVLPEYGLFRADERLLRENAESIAASLPAGQVVVAELGSGTGRKTAWLLEALAKKQPIVYSPIEISAKALDQCSRELGQLHNVDVRPLQQPYLDGLLSVAAARKPGEQLLVLFLGSTIGNFEWRAAELFLTEVRQALIPGDALLLSADLEKPISQLLPAYDDPLGVTASFDLNVLARMNRNWMPISIFPPSAIWPDMMPRNGASRCTSFRRVRRGCRFRGRIAASLFLKAKPFGLRARTSIGQRN